MKPPASLLPRLAALASLMISLVAQAQAVAPNKGFRVEKGPGAIAVTNCGRLLMRYQLDRPPDSKLSVESAGYVHPFATPKGVVLTDVAPDDHRHHRGIFLAWVEMHGAKDADFWGWGEHAPKNGRRIVSKEAAVDTPPGHATRAAFRVKNAWEAEDEPVLQEDLDVAVREIASAHVLDLSYTLTPVSDVTLAQWAFSGFCVRVRKDGKLEASGPAGALKLPNPKHTDPKSDWPSSAWYDYTLTFDDGSVAGAAVIDHPKNPPSLWHNHRGVRMLNPCIVAPGAVTLRANEPLTLRYRVVAHDGPADKAVLDRLAQEWAEGTIR